MKLGIYLLKTKEKFVLIEDKHKMLIASGAPKELFGMLSAFILKNKVMDVMQEIEDSPISIIIDCEVVINVSKC